MVCFLHDMQRGVFRGCSRKIKVWISVRNQHTQSTPKGEVCKNVTEKSYSMPLQEGEGKRIMKRREPDREEGEPCLECKATVLNINAGRNNDMMRKCRRLTDYAEFIAQIRWKMDEGWSLEEATEISIKWCIDRGILADILTKHGTEVCRMILTEYDEQEEREYQRAEGRAEG